MTRALIRAILLLAAGLAAPAHAEERRVGSKAPEEELAEGSPRAWSIDGAITVVTDYRTGGISSTEGKPAVQAEIDLVHRSGFFARAWGSTITPNDGGTIELDLSAGYNWQIGTVEPSTGATLYLFPGIDHSSYVELFQEIAIPLGGPSSLTIGAAFTPAQTNVDRSNLYLGAALEAPVGKSGFVVDAALGRENGAFGDDKLDWLVGGRFRRGHIEIGAWYSDTRRAFAPHSGPTLIISLSAWLKRR